MKRYIISAFVISLVLFIGACGLKSQIKSVNPDNEINEPCGVFLISEDFKKVGAGERWHNFMGDDGKCLFFAQEPDPGPPPKREVPEALVALDMAAFILIPVYGGANFNSPEFIYPRNSIFQGSGKFEDMKYYDWIINTGSGYEKSYVLRPGSGIQYRVKYSEKTDDLNSFKENSELLKLIGFRDNSNN